MRFLQIVLFGAAIASCNTTHSLGAPALNVCVVDYGSRHWDLREMYPGGDSIQVTYHTVSHDLHSNLDAAWTSMEPYCGVCAKYISQTAASSDLFPRGMALPLKVIDCLYFVDAKGKPWHSPIAAKLTTFIVRDEARQGPPANQVLEWPPRVCDFIFCKDPITPP